MLKQASVVALVAVLSACKGETVDDDTGVDTSDSTETDDTSDSSEPEDTSDTSEDTEPAPTVVSLIVHPAQAAVEKGATTQLRAREWLSDGSSRPATGTVGWEVVSGPAAVDSSGRLTASETGSVVLRATAGAHAAQAVAIAYGTGQTVASLAVAPTSTTLLAGQGAVLAAQARLGDGTVGDIGAACTWSAANPAIVLAGAAGAITAVAAGATTVTADCGVGGTADAAITVLAASETLPQAALSVTALRSVWLGDGALAFEVDLLNSGGQSPPFTLDLTVNAASAPTAAGDLTVMVPGLATGQALTLRLPGRFEGARPSTLLSWAQLDRAGAVPEADRADNTIGPVELGLPGDLTADLRVAFYGLTVFGPNEAGVEGEIFNDGPDDLTGLTVWFERDQPGTTLYTDLETGDAERSETFDLPAGESYYWVFDYNQAPLDPEEWYSCMFVKANGFVDSDLTNNFACRTVTEW